ncbi:MAG: tRNA pseudouridine(38-40) synthase TruA [Acidimicrobiales bacterium]
MSQGGVPTGPVRRWRLVVAYDGSGFRGFADQPGVPTVAGTLSAAIGRVARTSEDPRIVCAGRTDAGVHARGQVVHVDLPDPLPTIGGGGEPRRLGAEDLQRAVNRQLSPSIVVRSVEPAPSGFDARHSAVARSYRYLVHAAPLPDPLLAPFAWHVSDRLDVRAMIVAADPLIGEHDFRAFCRRRPGADPAEPVVRTVVAAGWSEVPCEAVDGRLLRFDIVAGSFCHQMVRSLVGTLVAVGKGRGNVATVVGLLRSGSRSGAPDPAPPHGLCLTSVSYGER